MSYPTFTGGGAGPGSPPPIAAPEINEGAPLTDMVQLTLGDEKPVEVTSTSSGSYTMNQTANRGDGYSPSTERYSPPFVRNGARSQSDDPFQPTPRPRPLQVPGTPKSARIMSKKSWRSGSGSDEDASASSSPLNHHSQPTARRLSFHVQEYAGEGADSQLTAYVDVDPEDAQAVYPPAYCLFVANLLQSESDESLAASVTAAFRDYGKVFVKIRRDGKQMPFGFCQFTKMAHAQTALREAPGRLINGRACRVEKAKAHREPDSSPPDPQPDADTKAGSFFIERKFGPVITPAEARELLEPFGKLTLCYTVTEVERSSLNLNEGVMVNFELYDLGKEALLYFRNHHLYKMQNIAGYGSPPRTIYQDRSPSSVNARAYLARYDVDRRSIFVGNLPAGVTEDEIKQVFNQYGPIRDIMLRESPSRFASQEKIHFGFIQFKSTVEADKVIDDVNGFVLRGKRLRVAHKDSQNRARVNNAYGSTVPTGHCQSPAPYKHSAPYQSPAPRLNEQQVSPMSQISPPGYGSPFSYPYSPYYNYSYGPPPPPFIADGQNFYPPTPYQPYYGYPGSPSYDPRSSSAPEVTGGASPHYSYSPYNYAPAPFWGFPNTSVEQQASSPTADYSSSYTAALVSNDESEDRSTTPTPSGHVSIAEELLETQSV